MDAEDALTSTFEGHRPHLRAVAYRMLGSSAEADDAVQEAWLRYRRTDTTHVANLGGSLPTVVSRVCLNLLRSRTARREEPLDAHVPDPVVTPVAALDPEQEVVLADSVGLALLIVLDKLAPAERVAFVLHDAGMEALGLALQRLALQGQPAIADPGEPRHLADQAGQREAGLRPQDPLLGQRGEPELLPADVEIEVGRDLPGDDLPRREVVEEVLGPAGVDQVRGDERVVVRLDAPSARSVDP